jgi:hypothetical protein
MMYAAGRGHVVREFYSVFLPLGAVVFLLVYVFLINPEALHELGRWAAKLSIRSVARQLFLKFWVSITTGHKRNGGHARVRMNVGPLSG